ncbi:MAG: DNA-formamidopyrimidine glycosylase [Erysipelotrichia bacterium]|nr:DNA-formamidopyrimidine glycosylase [Erysipelotrichia bacterium]NCC55504.1 DNA-formamidopyrimidine glycosylase [Erysipelotrichia bacterium]
MPELPEVETVLRTLEKQMGTPQISKVQVLYDKMIATSDVQTFVKGLSNECIIDYHRLGKYLIFECQAHYLIVHMRMEGKFYLQLPDEPYDKHTHVLFDLADGRQLRYHDTRKFGRMYLYGKEEDYRSLSCFKNVGYDVFDENLHAMVLYQASRHKKITLKQFLLEQKVMAGVGNIYADEICYACALHPCTRVYRLSKKDCENILFETRRILNGAIKAGGTTIRSYTSSLKVDGRFQLQLKVHERKGEICARCGQVIEKIQVAGRGTSFCKACQKRK